jgi:hypothetical protein
MHKIDETTLARLLSPIVGEKAAAALLADVHIPPAIAHQHGDSVDRATFAFALALILFQDLESRVPLAATYRARRIGAGEKIIMDHGALRTILMPSGPTGALPAGRLAFDRILAPLGYHPAETYPLPRLRMTGYGYRHHDLPVDLPQYFVSELHVDQFDTAFAGTAARVFGSSIDPLNEADQAILARFAAKESVPFIEAAAALPRIAAAFDRHHGPITADDYETLLAQSAEAAWIATEGNAFNHATDRVPNVEALAETLRQEEWPIKDRVEISTSGRVRQTALRAHPVERHFTQADGNSETRTVPGSFYEFISRDIHPETGALDLAFDSGNATGIFAMTKSA